MPNLLAGAVIVVVVLLGGCARAPEGPQQIEMTLGSTATVGGGRATLWFASFEDAWRQDLGRIATVIKAEVKCREDSRLLDVYHDRPTEAVCGVRVRLLEVKKRGDPIGAMVARFEVNRD